MIDKILLSLLGYGFFRRYFEFVIRQIKTSQYLMITTLMLMTYLGFAYLSGSLSDNAIFWLGAVVILQTMSVLAFFAVPYHILLCARLNTHNIPLFAFFKFNHIQDVFNVEDCFFRKIGTTQLHMQAEEFLRDININCKQITDQLVNTDLHILFEYIPAFINLDYACNFSGQTKEETLSLLLKNNKVTCVEDEKYHYNFTKKSCTSLRYKLLTSKYTVFADKLFCDAIILKKPLYTYDERHLVFNTISRKLFKLNKQKPLAYLFSSFTSDVVYTHFDDVFKLHAIPLILDSEDVLLYCHYAKCSPLDLLSEEALPKDVKPIILTLIV